MHPTEHELILYVQSGQSGQDSQSPIALHLTGCEACQCRLRAIEEWGEAETASSDAGLPAPASDLADQLYSAALVSSRLVRLQPLKLDGDSELITPIRLAADGERQSPSHAGLEHRATLYSEQPDLVLRLMFDPRTEQESLHLIGTDSETTANVLIHLVEPSIDFVTDAAGIAQVEGASLEHPETLEWQVQLPDATFTLAPLEGGLDVDEGEQIVETDRGDRIGVTVKPEREGISLQIRIAHLAGHTGPGRVRLIVTQKPGAGQLIERTPSQPILIRGLNSEQPVHIRVFAD